MAFAEDVLLRVKETLLNQLLEFKDTTAIKSWTIEATVDHCGYQTVFITTEILLPNGQANIRLAFDIDSWNQIMKENKLETT